MATKPIQKQEFENEEERTAALRAKCNGFNKSLGIKGITRASDLVPRTRSGFDVKELDELTGGGLVHGAFVTVWGGPGSGKTTLAYKACAKAQREGKTVYWIALEPFCPERAVYFGVNLEKLMVGQFPQAEMSLDSIILLAKDKLVDVIILDSIHSMSPKAEQENSKGEKSTADNSIGLLARKLSQFFPMALDAIKRANIAVMLIGQTRMSIGFISFDHLSGGNALLHNSRLTMRLRRGASDNAPRQVTYEEQGDGKKKKIEKIIGFESVAKLDKVQITGSKPELSTTSLPYYFESGYDLPKFIQEENAEIEKSMSGNNVEEESEQFNGSKSSETEIKTEENTNKSENISEPVRKRGRPKKEKK